MKGRAFPAMVVVSLLSGREEPRRLAVARLARDLGPLSCLTPPLSFGHSQYYAAEMGPGLTRRLAAFTRLVEPWDLARIKRACLDLEDELAQDGRRQVNIDPGLLGPGALTMATTKASPHRVAIAPGLWAETTLLFQRGAFTPLPWTYQDYAGPCLQAVLRLMRGRYLWQLRQARRQGGQTCSNP
jgi:hypothetical protein